MAYKFQMGTFKPSGSIQITDNYGLSGSGKAEIAGNLSVGNGGAYGLSKTGDAKIASMGSNWTNASLPRKC